jgi:hypothetical protein
MRHAFCRARVTLESWEQTRGFRICRERGEGVGKVGLLWYKPVFKYHMQNERGALEKVCEKQKWEQDRQYKFNVTLLCVRVMFILPLL